MAIEWQLKIRAFRSGTQGTEPLSLRMAPLSLYCCTPLLPKGVVHRTRRRLSPSHQQLSDCLKLRLWEALGEDIRLLLGCLDPFGFNTLVLADV